MDLMDISDGIFELFMTTHNTCDEECLTLS